MAIPSTVKVLEQCKVSSSSPPPPQTTCNIPLTFFDIPWLFFSPNQPLFFYKYHHPTSHFLSKSLPTLKHTLSLTLHHFFPFSGNLTTPPPPHKPYIACTQNDHVSLTVAESTADNFHHLTQYHNPINVSEFHPLVPELRTTFSGCERRQLPLLSIQVTVFPMSGLCLGFAYHHVVADYRTFNNFIKTWSSLCSDDSNFISLPIKTLPTFDRTLVLDRDGLEEVFLNEWFQKKCHKEEERKVVLASETVAAAGLSSDMVRATFVVDPTHMDRIKKWIFTQCMKKNQTQPVHLSPYVLTCSFVWVCLVRSLFQESYHFGRQDPLYFGFNAGGINRLDYRVPASYFGNCVGFGRAIAVKEELLGEDGVVVAANAIGNTIKTLDKALLVEAGRWISDWEAMVGSDTHVMVSGSPKVDLYDTDFGWGRAVKIEEISIDKKRGISLIESRDIDGGIEVGLALSKIHMDAFVCFFNQGLTLLQ